MRLDLLRSTSGKDRPAESYKYVAHSAYRGAINDDDSIHNHFDFEDYRGETPHARVSLNWADVEGIVAAFIGKGHPEALRLGRARKLAAAVDEFAKISD